MSTLTVRLNKDEKEIFKEYADFYNKPLSTLMKDVFLKHIENEIDKKLLKQAIDIKNHDNSTISFETFEKEFLDEIQD